MMVIVMVTVMIQDGDGMEQILSEAADFMVEKNKPCIKTCLDKLVLLMKNDEIIKLNELTVDSAQIEEVPDKEGITWKLS